MRLIEIEIARLTPPPTRPVATASKLQRMGSFDQSKYTPIIVEKNGSTFMIQDGMTRVAMANEAGLTKLQAYIFEDG